MPSKNFVRSIALGACLIGMASPLPALYNNVYLVSATQDAQVADSWLADLLPAAPAETKTADISVATPTLVPTTGEVRFSPSTTPGASFRHNENEFSEFRETFRGID